MMPLRLLGRFLRWVPSSLGLRLAASVVIPAAILLVAAALLFTHLDHDRARATSVQSDGSTAAVVAKALGKGAQRQILPFFQQLLGDDQLQVYRHGRTLYQGPTNTGPDLFTVSRAFPGGRVIVVGDVEGQSGLTAEITAIVGVIIAILVVVSVIGSTSLTRSLRRPIGRAAGAAGRVAAGDLRARIEDSGPEQFRHLVRAFNSMAARLEEADRSERRLLADLAHEIATPLNSVAAVASAVVDGTVSSASQREEATALLRNEVDRIRSLLDSLRNLRQLDLSGPRQPRQVDLRDLAATVARRLAPTADQASVTLQVQARRPAVVVIAPELVDTALTNLVSNAIRYTPPGGRVDVRVQPGGHGRWCIAVRDTGIGIPPEHRERIFDRFYRVDQARGRSSGGSGLGLAIARGAALALGGAIELSSDPGAGSEFRLIVPVQMPPTHSQGAEPPANEAPARSCG
jgi:signal transduction histidine kinase